MKSLKQKLSQKFYQFALKIKPFISNFIPSERFLPLKNRLFHSGLSTVTRSIEVDDSLPSGINVVGYINSYLGQGQGARFVLSSLQSDDVSCCAIDVPTGVSTIRVGDTGFSSILVKAPIYKTNLFHVLPDNNFSSVLMRNPGIIEKHYNIGYWMFELENLPEDWTKNFKFVNEIWCPSNFATDAFKKSVLAIGEDIPVLTMPYGIEVSKNETLTREDFGLPENAFLVLTMFDSGSTSARKNPMGSIRAFAEAFKESKDAFLVIKIQNPTDEDIAVIQNALDGSKNCLFIDQTFSKEDLNSLIGLCDVYLSLHRSEGFGLPVAEAMALGTVVVATDYSGTTDFLSSTTGCPIPYTMEDVSKSLENHVFYKRGNLWANPDEHAAAEKLRFLKENPDDYRMLQKNAIDFMKKNYSLKISGERMEKRLKTLNL